MPLFFWFDLFLEARAEILGKKIIVFLGYLRTEKRYFEINWPLMTSWGDFTSLHAMISDFRITEKAAICTQEIRDRITVYPGYNLSIMLNCSSTKNEFQIFVNFLNDGLVFTWKQIRLISPENCGDQLMSLLSRNLL